MLVAIGQIDTIIGDFKGNGQKIYSYVQKAAAHGADLIVFPEMCVCGYPPMDLLDHESFVEENLKTVRWLQYNCPPQIGVLIGYVDKNLSSSGKRLKNVASIIKNGRILMTQEKTLLPTYDVFDEARYFEPATERKVIPWGSERIGIAICEDVWWEVEASANIRYPIDPVKDLLDRGATLIICPSSSPFYIGKPEVRFSLLSKIGNTSGIPAIYVNMVGGNDSLIFDGRSMVTSPEGKLVFLDKAFQESLSFVETDSERKEVPLELEKNSELESALVLGLRDYFAKCGFDKAHLNLSGGIDSSLAAAIAVKALGPKNVVPLALPSRYSSEGSYNDAKKLCDNLGMDLMKIDIEPIFS